MQDFEHVKQVTQSFRDESLNEEPPSIVVYLGKVKDGLKPTLLKNLLQVDIERRRQRGEHPKPEDYLKWFPEHESIIRQEFLESISLHASTTPSLLGETDLRPAEMLRSPTVSRLGEYHLVGELGRGGMGLVYEAVHTQRQDHVALKILPNVDAQSLHLFKREFRSLADINHPNLIGLHSLECDGDQWFFTMDLIEGTDFLSFVRPDNELDEARLRSALPQLVSGVLALHSNYVVHRDLKPSNVMVNQNGRVILLDFGLVLEMESISLQDTAQGITGTPAYMSPEQAGGQNVTPASDWYSVGVMLYEALSGKHPYQGSMLEVLQQKQSSDPSPLNEDIKVQDLTELCYQLLNRNPSERPDSFKITQSVAATAPHVVSSHEEQQLIGRSDQLELMQNCLEEFVKDATPRVVYVKGRSGEGKTTLCEAFLKKLRKNKRFAVMSGRCYDRESVPFKALDSTIDAVCRYLNGLTQAEITAMLPRDVAMLIHLFPVVGRVKGIRKSKQSVNVQNLDVEEVRARGFQALRDLLGRISDRHPIILFIDDLQWGDADSAEILLQLMQPPLAPQLFFLGTFRSDETGESRFLQAWEELKVKEDIQINQRFVEVSPFSQAECTQLVVDLLQQQNETILQRSIEFYEQTGGNPFLLTELVGCFDPQTDSFRPMPVEEVIEEKLGRLPGEARLLLEVVAISGQVLNMEEASIVAGEEVIPTATFTRMRTERLLRFIGSEEANRIDTYHDRIRETVLARMADNKKKILHRKLGEQIERTSGGFRDDQLARLLSGKLDSAMNISDRLFDLSFHFDEAEIIDKACAYSLLAAEKAREQYALEVAFNLYQIARKNSKNCSDIISRRILSGLGRIATLLGRYPEADESLRKAHLLSSNLLDRCEIESLQGDLLFNLSLYKACNDTYVSALKSLGVSVPRSRIGYVLGILREIGIQTTHMFNFHRIRPDLLDRKKKLVLELLRGSFVSFFVRNVPGVVWANLKTMNEAEKYGPSKELAIAYSYHLIICATIGFNSRGKKFESLSQNMIEENDLSGQMMHLLGCGVGAYVASQYEVCKTKTERGLKLSQKTGDVWKTRVARLHYLLSEYRLGNLQNALQGALEEFFVSVRYGDYNTAYDFIQLVSIVSDGRFDYEKMNSVLKPIPDNIQATNIKLQAEARWHLAHRRTEQALTAIERAYELMKANLVVNHITTSTFPLYLRILREHAKALAQTDSVESTKILKRASHFAKWCIRFTNNTVDSPETLREVALLYQEIGKTKQALKIIKKACEVAAKQNAHFEFARSKQSHAEFLRIIGQGSEEDVDIAKKEFQEFADSIKKVHQVHELLDDEPPNLR